SAAASMCASPTPAPRRCTSSPRSTGWTGCAASWDCSRASSPAPPTATTAWPTSLRPRSCISAPASPTASPISTTPTRPAPACAKPAAPSQEAVREAARVLRSGEPTLILVTGRAVREDGLALAGKIAAKTGARIIAQGSNARTQRGRGRVSVERIPYVVDQALKVLAGLKHVILVGAKMPVAFFAYPDKPSRLYPEGCEGHVLARPEEDLIAALEMLCEEVGARDTPAPVVNDAAPQPASGAITSEALGASIGALLPENAIVADEAVTTGRGFFAPTKAAKPHDWLSNMGGSIGLGPPLATGAAVACPDRKGVGLQADGSA